MRNWSSGPPASFYVAVTVAGIIVGTLLAIFLFIANRWGDGGGDLLQSLATLVAVLAAALIAAREWRHSARLTIHDRRYAEYVAAATGLESTLREHESLVRSWTLDYIRRVDWAREVGERSSSRTPWNPISTWNIPRWCAERVAWERAEHDLRYTFRSHMERWLLVDGPSELRTSIERHDRCAQRLIERAEQIFSDSEIETFLMMPDRKTMTKEMVKASVTFRQPLLDSLNEIRTELQRHVASQRESLSLLAQ